MVIPLLEAAVYLPTVDTALDVSFLVDTGADFTFLHPYDDLTRQFSGETWSLIREQPTIQIAGAGRGLPYYQVPGELALAHTGGGYERIQLDFYVAEPHPDLNGLESLLGRDILQDFVTTFDGLESVTLDPK
jgi:hypothetical protein